MSRLDFTNKNLLSDVGLKKTLIPLDEIIQEGKPKEIETSRSIFQIRKQIFKNIKKIICELEINGRYIKP